MESLMKGRTTFIIAHRQSTLRKCRVQLFLEKGRLVAGDDQAPALSGVGVSSLPGLRAIDGMNQVRTGSV
jgi:ABC-type bacteriocin/lantibiotic exporter with double-glycine peptidase domain